jgi:hypothetical protein
MRSAGRREKAGFRLDFWNIPKSHAERLNQFATVFSIPWQKMSSLESQYKPTYTKLLDRFKRA